MKAGDSRGGRRTWWWLGSLLLLSLALRVPNLAAPDFGVDEVLHVHAAKSLLEGGGLSLPDGRPYLRAELYTRGLALTGRLLGLDERSARLPSVLFGVLVPVLLFLVGRSCYSPRVGMVAAVVAVIAPSQIVFSRMARMYALFQLLYLVLVFLLFYLFEPRARLLRSTASGGGEGGSTLSWTEKILVGVLALLCLVLARHFHPLVLPALLGPFVFLVLRVPFVLADRASAPRERAYLSWVFGLSLAAAAAVLLWQRGNLGAFLSDAQFVPDWAAGNREDAWFYLRATADRFSPVFLLIAALGVVLPGRRRTATFYLACCLAAPLLLQSLFLPWKTYRYLFHLLPVLYLLFALGLESSARCVAVAVRGGLPAAQDRRSRLTTRLVAVGLAGIVVGAGWIAESARYLTTTVTAADGVWHNSWREALGVVEAKQGGDQPLVTTKPLLAAYYGDPESLVMLNNRVSLAQEPQFAAGGGEIRTLGDLQGLVRKSGVVWLVCERWLYYDSATIPPAVREFVEQNGRRFFVERAADMVIVRIASSAAAVDETRPREGGDRTA